MKNKIKSVCIIIPARLSSSRLPNKPLADICGKSMIQRVYEKCKESDADEVVVATEDEDIFNHVSEFGKCVLTPEFENGTLRVCYAAKDLNKIYDYIINVQGDEPFIDVSFLNRFISDLITNVKHPGIIMTGASKLEKEQYLDSNSVKLISNKNYTVSGYTRSPIFNENPSVYKHVGIYGFCFYDIEYISQLKPSDLSMRNSLEQIRWMEDGYRMKFTICYQRGFSIDTQRDLEYARSICSE